MGELLFWVLLFLLFVAAVTLPGWPHTRSRELWRKDSRWRYAPSGLAIAIAVIILLLAWIGVVLIAWPWAAAS